MEQDILISVIVPVYNADKYLVRCVDSILNQTYSNLEIILVDDGAKDNSGAMCDDFARKDARIRVIHKENGGLSSARNAGIDIAKGEYFGFVDSDDWIEPEMYETMLTLARKNDAELVVAGRYDVDADTMEKTVGLCPRQEEVISGIELLGRVFVWDNCDSSSCDKLFHRSLYDGLRYAYGVVSEDVALFPYTAERVKRAVLCDKPFYNYYHHGGTISTSSVSEKTFHFGEHTGVIYDYIRQAHPEIQEQARRLRVSGLIHSILSCELADAENRRKFMGRCRKCRAELRKHLGFIMKHPAYGRKDRLTNLLLALGLYRFFRPIYHALK